MEAQLWENYNPLSYKPVVTTEIRYWQQQVATKLTIRSNNKSASALYILPYHTSKSQPILSELSAAHIPSKCNRTLIASLFSFCIRQGYKEIYIHKKTRQKLLDMSVPNMLLWSIINGFQQWHYPDEILKLQFTSPLPENLQNNIDSCEPIRLELPLPPDEDELDDPTLSVAQALGYPQD